MDQRNKRERPEIDSQYDQSIFDKSAKASVKKEIPFQEIFLEQLDIHMPKKVDLNLYLTHYRKINSKETTSINVIRKVIILLKKT